MKAMNLIFLAVLALFFGFAASVNTPWYPEDVNEAMKLPAFKNMLQAGLRDLCSMTVVHAAELGCPNIKLAGINAIDTQRVVGKKARFNVDIANPQDEITNVLIYVFHHATEDLIVVTNVSFPDATTATVTV